MASCAQNQCYFSDVRLLPNIYKKSATAFPIFQLGRSGLCFSLFFSVVLTFFSTVALAEDIAVCGESSGYAYYANRGINQSENVGWSEDKISGGKFTLSQDDKGQLDLLISDATGRVFSSLSQGSKIFPAISADSSLTVIIVNDQLVETYIFQILKNGKFQAMYTDAKAEAPFPKVSAFIADCSYLNLKALK